MSNTPNKIKFSVISDFHYRKHTCASTVDDLNTIFDRAKEKDTDFLIHCGDFCNDYSASPEIVKAYLQNKHGISVYGTYGNHELEGKNSMANVTPCLTNDKSVVWGTEDGKIGDGSIGYYYFDKDNFRIINIDTSYSFCHETNEWEHIRPGGWDCHQGNSYWEAIGPAQLEWLEKVLKDAAEKRLSCITVSHCGFFKLPDWYRYATSADSEKILKLFDEVNKIQPKTVVMCISGHNHTNHTTIHNNILFVDINSVIGSPWLIHVNGPHHSEEDTFNYIDFDNEGNIKGRYQKPYNSLTFCEHIYYYSNPISAIVTISSDGEITIEGQETTWAYNIIPEEINLYSGVEPRISSGNWKID